MTFPCSLIYTTPRVSKHMSDPITSCTSTHTPPLCARIPLFGLELHSVSGCHLNIASYFKIRSTCSIFFYFFCLYLQQAGEGLLPARIPRMSACLMCLSNTCTHTQTRGSFTSINPLYSRPVATQISRPPWPSSAA